MEDVKLMSARGDHCNNENKSTQECQERPGEKVGKQSKEYRESPVGTIVCTPTTSAWLLR